MIKAAPLSFVIACGLALIVSIVAMQYLYKERLAAKDDMLGFYKEKLGVLPDQKSRFSGARNEELKGSAISLAGSIREFVNRHKEADQNMDRFNATEMANAPPESKQDIWQRQTEQATRRSFEFMAVYEQQFKSDVLSLRDEILSRLSEDKRRTFGGWGIEERPTNRLGVEEVAARLEKLANLLPL